MEEKESIKKNQSNNNNISDTIITNEELDKNNFKNILQNESKLSSKIIKKKGSSVSERSKSFKSRPLTCSQRTISIIEKNLSINRSMSKDRYNNNLNITKNDPHTEQALISLLKSSDISGLTDEIVYSEILPQKSNKDEFYNKQKNYSQEKNDENQYENKQNKNNMYNSSINNMINNKINI